MTNINDRKIKDLERSVFTIKVTSALSRFFVDDNLYEEINERWIYINEMYNSLEKYSTLYKICERPGTGTKDISYTFMR